jgi:hypothetical protein
MILSCKVQLKYTNLKPRLLSFVTEAYEVYSVKRRRGGDVGYKERENPSNNNPPRSPLQLALSSPWYLVPYRMLYYHIF